MYTGSIRIELEVVKLFGAWAALSYVAFFAMGLLIKKHLSTDC